MTNYDNHNSVEEVRSTSGETDKLYESLVRVELPDSLSPFKVVDAYMRATCVAAGITFDKEFLQKMLLALAEQANAQRGEEVPNAPDVLTKEEAGLIAGNLMRDDARITGLNDDGPETNVPTHKTLCVPPGAVREELFTLICDNWECLNKDAEHVARDAFGDLISTMCWDDLPTILFPIFRLSDYWPEQIVRAAVGLPNDDTDDLEGMRDALTDFIARKTSSQPEEHDNRSST